MLTEPVPEPDTLSSVSMMMDFTIPPDRLPMLSLPRQHDS